MDEFRRWLAKVSPSRPSSGGVSDEGLAVSQVRVELWAAEVSVAFLFGRQWSLVTGHSPGPAVLMVVASDK
jgi:hypothetical protein